jgi:hypothetical protein
LVQGQADNLKPLLLPSKEFEDEEKAMAKASPEQAAEMEAELAEDISFAKLNNYIIDNHPTAPPEEGEEDTDDVKQFGMCDYLGSHHWLCCGVDDKISPLSKQIGIGATMFLMSAKSLACLFFVLTLINIPVFLFYWGSDRANTRIESP